MAIKGVARFHKDKKRHIITTQTVRPLHGLSLVRLIVVFSEGAQMCSRFLSKAAGGGLRRDLPPRAKEWRHLS